VKFVVQTVPGPLHTIGSAVFNGPTQGLDSPLRQAAAAYQDLPATTANINGLRADVEKVFTTRGYTKVSISMAMDTKSETKRLHPVFTIHPGIRYRRGGFEIDGIRRTRPEAIKMAPVVQECLRRDDVEPDIAPN
jgi:outer membrane protein assembly factor BamA